MDGNNDVTLGLAFVAGIISFISPCVLPLIPAYIGYMGGRVTQQVSTLSAASNDVRRRFGTLTHAVFFVLGFTLFFVVFGLLTTAAVSALTSFGVSEAEVRNGIARIGGTVVILFGLHIMGVLNLILMRLSKQAAKLDQNPYGNLISTLIGIALIGLIYWLFVESWFLTLVVLLIFALTFRDALKADTSGQFWTRIIERIQYALYVDTRRQDRPASQYGYLGSLFMGVVFSAGWTPCIGPIYAAVLAIAATGQDIAKAGSLLTAYSLGLGIPFLLTALALDQAQGVFRRLQKNMRKIEVVSGAFLLLIGVLVFSGELARLSQIGGSQGALGSASINLEECSVAVLRGEVRLSNWDECFRDGLKEDFYVTGPKVVAALPSDQVDTPDASAPPTDEGSTFEAPALDTTGNSASVGDVPVGLREGERAPDFTTTTLDGETVSLSDFEGQVVLLNFWATWCGPCQIEMPDFQTVYETYGRDGFIILAVNFMEPPDTIRPFVEQFNLSFPILLDESGEINAQYQIVGYPTNLLIDQNGVIVERFAGTLDANRLLDALENVQSQD